MGVHDEHWCSECRKYLDKTKDEYYELEIINADEAKLEKEGKHARGFLCKECFAKRENKGFASTVEKITKRGNPTFALILICRAQSHCADYKRSAVRKGAGSCRHIYVLNDKLYCSRRHPGTVRVNQDAVAIDNDFMHRMSKFVKGLAKKFKWPMLKNSDPLAGLSEALGMKSQMKLEDFCTKTPTVILEKLSESGFIPGIPQEFDATAKKWSPITVEKGKAEEWGPTVPKTDSSS